MPIWLAVRSSACPSVCLSAWLADWLVAHMLQARLDCIWRQLSLICWLEICEKQTQTCLPLPIPLSTLFYYKKYHEILKTENLSRQFHFSLSPARCKFVPASLSPESFVSLRTMSCNCLGFGFVFGLISMAAAWLVLATAHRKLPPPLSSPSLLISLSPCPGKRSPNWKAKHKSQLNILAANLNSADKDRFCVFKQLSVDFINDLSQML